MLITDALQLFFMSQTCQLSVIYGNIQ